MKRMKVRGQGSRKAVGNRNSPTRVLFKGVLPFIRSATILFTALVVLLSFFVSCERVKDGSSSHDEALSFYRVAYELFYGRRDYQGALEMINKDIAARGEVLENLELRTSIYLKLNRSREATSDLYSTFGAATRAYYENKDGGALFLSAYCIGMLGDQDRAKMLIRLLSQRHPETYRAYTEEVISKLVLDWYDIGEKKLRREGGQAMPVESSTP